MSTGHLTTPRSSLRRHWFLWLVLTVAILALACFSILQHRRANAGLEGLRKAGYPTTLAELNEWYQTVPDAEDAALQFMAASEQLRSSIPDQQLPIIGTPLARSNRMTLKERELLAQHFTNNTATFELARAAAALKRSRYPVDLNQGANALLPHLSSLKKLVQHLRVVSMLHAEEGRMEQAAQSYSDILGVARSLAREPLLISQLVRVACLTIGNTALEWLVNHEGLSDRQLQTLIAGVQEAELESRHGLKRALIGEQCLGIHFFRLTPAEFASLAAPPTSETHLLNATFSLMKVTGLRDGDSRFFCQVMKDWIETSEQPFPECLRKANATVQPLLRMHPVARWFLHPVSGMILPSFEKALLKEARNCAMLRGAETALALERYRLVNRGELPETLHQLFPSFMRMPHKDPFNDQPLCYKKLEQGYAVYSRGEDGKDDGGNSKTDVTFRVERRSLF